jgi:hypothetical protein
MQKTATPSDVYRNRLLENVSVAAFQDPTTFVARAVFPTIGGEDEVGKYYEFNMDTISQDKMRLRAPGTEAETGTWDVTQQAYACVQYGYKEKIPEEMSASAGPAADIDKAAAASVAEVALINAEARFANQFFKTGVWNRDMAGAAAADATHYVFWNRVSTPIDDVYAEKVLMMKAGKRKPNTLILGAEVAPKLLTNAQIVNRLNNGQTPGRRRDGVARGPREAVRCRSRDGRRGRLQQREGRRRRGRLVHPEQQVGVARLRQPEPDDHAAVGGLPLHVAGPDRQPRRRPQLALLVAADALVDGRGRRQRRVQADHQQARRVLQPHRRVTPRMSLMPPPPAPPMPPYKGCSYVVALPFVIGERHFKSGEDFPLDAINGDEGLAVAMWRTARIAVKPPVAEPPPAQPKQQGRAARR